MELKRDSGDSALDIDYIQITESVPTPNVVTFDSSGRFTDPLDNFNHMYDRKEKLFKIQDSVRIRKISVTNDNADSEALMKQIQEDIGKGVDFEAAAAGYKGQVTLEDQTFDARNAHGDMLAYPVLAEKTALLQPGQVTDLLVENGKYVISKCLARDDGGYRAIDEVKEGIRNYLAGKAYDRMVDQQIHSAKVIINDKVYKHIGVDDLG